MNTVILLIELFALGVFLSALAMACAQRRTAAWQRWLIFCLPSALPLAVSLTLAFFAITLVDLLPGDLIAYAVLLALGQLTATGFLLYRGFFWRPAAADTPTLPWPRAPLAAGLVVTALIHVLSLQAAAGVATTELLEARLHTGSRAAALVPAGSMAENALLDIQSAAAHYDPTANAAAAAKAAGSTPTADPATTAFPNLAAWAVDDAHPRQPAPDPAYLQQFRRQNESARQALLQSATKSVYVNTLNYATLGPNDYLECLRDLEHGLTLLLIDARAAAQQGDRSRALQDLHTYAHLLALLADHPFLMEYLYLLRNIQDYSQAVTAVLADLPLPAADIQSLRLPASLDLHESYRRMLVLEEAMGIGSFCTARDMIRNDDPQIDMPGAHAAAYLYEAYLLRRDIHIYQNAIEHIRVAATATTDPVPDLDRDRLLLSRLLLPGLEALRRETQSGRARVDLLSCALAAAAYHADHGAWPQRLTDLQPGYLPQLPLDAFTGQAYTFQQMDHRCRLASVGPNRRDDSTTAPAAPNTPNAFNENDDIVLLLTPPPATPALPATPATPATPAQP